MSMCYTKFCLLKTWIVPTDRRPLVGGSPVVHWEELKETDDVDKTQVLQGNRG